LTRVDRFIRNYSLDHLPALNQELELEYLRQRSTWFDLWLVWQFIRGVIVSQGNVKARGQPDAALEDRLKIDRS
jgi:lipopolysaccharide/colanic/teichoic acid biosynthesis glycosyltransferase